MAELETTQNELTNDDTGRFNDEIINLFNDVEDMYFVSSDSVEGSVKGDFATEILNANTDEIVNQERSIDLNREIDQDKAGRGVANQALKRFGGNDSDKLGRSRINIYHKPKAKINLSFGDVAAKSIFCNVCGKCFHNYNDLEKHELSVSKRSHSFICRTCGIHYKFWVQLHMHARKCLSESKFESVERIYAKEHPQFIQYHCEFCNKGFAVLEDFHSHRSKIHVREFPKCSICSSIFSNWMPFFLHMRRHSLIGNVDLECEQCSLHFYLPSVFRLHNSRIHKQKHIRYKCCLCVVVSTDLEEFLTHVHRHGNYFKDKDNKSHDIIVKNGRPQLFFKDLQCAVCSMVINSKDGLLMHRRAVHPEQFTIWNSQNTASESVASNSKEKSNIICHICELGVCKEELAEHIAAHTRNMVLSRDDSNDANSKDRVQVLCSTCNVFIDINELTTHKDTHTVVLE